MNFIYDYEEDNLLISLSEESPILWHFMQDDFAVGINGAGSVVCIRVDNPGVPWPIKDIIYSYELPISAAYFLTLLAERYAMFKFQ